MFLWNLSPIYLINSNQFILSIIIIIIILRLTKFVLISRKDGDFAFINETSVPPTGSIASIAS